MARKNQHIFTILGAAIGTGLAVYGIQRGIQWYQQRRMPHRYNTQLPDRSWPVEQHYQSIELEQPDLAPIPATGSVPAAPPMTEMTSAERVNSDMVGDFDDRGTAFSVTEMNNTQVDEMASEDIPVTGSMTGSQIYGDLRESFGVRGEDAARIDTGRGTDMGSGATQQFNTEPMMSGQSSEIVMDEYVAPLIEHSIAFNSVMNLLRSRQRDGEGNEGIESLTTGDRNSMRAVLDQMQEKLVETNEATLRQNPLAHRSYQLTRKLRDALDNLDYTGTDLYRIQEEVRTELCTLADELDRSGQVTITGLDQIRQLYECR